jgi:hypothetical protein
MGDESMATGMMTMMKRALPQITVLYLKNLFFLSTLFVTRTLQCDVSYGNYHALQILLFFPFFQTQCGLDEDMHDTHMSGCFR